MGEGFAVHRHLQAHAEFATQLQAACLEAASFEDKQAKSGTSIDQTLCLRQSAPQANMTLDNSLPRHTDILRQPILEAHTRIR